MKRALGFIFFIVSGMILLFKYVVESHCKCPTIWITFYMLGAIICFILAVVIAFKRSGRYRLRSAGGLIINYEPMHLLLEDI